MSDTQIAMSVSGWMFLAVAWSGILSVLAFCLYRVLTKPQRPGLDDDGDEEPD